MLSRLWCCFNNRGAPLLEENPVAACTRSIKLLKGYICREQAPYFILPILGFATVLIGNFLPSLRDKDGTHSNASFAMIMVGVCVEMVGAAIAFRRICHGGGLTIDSLNPEDRLFIYQQIGRHIGPMNITENTSLEHLVTLFTQRRNEAMTPPPVGLAPMV